jgi:hypothetical protein
VRAVALAALFAIACSEPPPRIERPRSALPAESGPLDALNRRHARLRERVRLRGYGEQVGLTRALVLEDQGHALPLDLPGNACSTFIALGGGTIRELSLALYDGEGAEASRDSVGSEGGLVHVCPRGDAYTPYYLVMRAEEGAGAVLVAQFQSELGMGEGFEGLFEGVLAPRVPLRDVEAHLAQSRTALRARGFSPLGEPLLERVTEGSVVRVVRELSAGQCYVAIGRAGDGLRDVDLFLFDAVGVEVSRDLAADAQPSIEHCPRETGAFTVELRAFEGAGAVGLLVFAGPGQPGAPPGDVEATLEERSTEDPSLALEVLAAPLRARGFGPPVFVSRDAAIVPGEVRTHEVVVGPGCAIVAGAASHDGMDLDLYLADEAGRELDQDTAVHSTARVRACRAAPTVVRVAVKAYGRDGSYALAVLRAPDEVDTLQSLRLEEASAPYRSRGYVESLVFEGVLEQGGRLRRPISVERGRCVAVAAAGDDGVLDLDLFLRSAEEQLVTSDSGPSAIAALARCAQDTLEELTLEVAMYRGSGRVVVRVLAPPIPEASQAP